MKIDLGVVSTTVTDYDDVITNIGDIKSRIKDTESDLSNRGWSGEAQKKYSELVKWFLEKDYECLEENLKCIKEVLNNEAKKQGGALKNRCEDFVSCFDGSERGVYPESSGEIAGILSLEYNNSASVIDNVTHITNKLIAQKRAALEDLSKTINGGWFSSGLIFSSLNIDNELAESSNEMFKEEKRLNAFLQSFVQYTPGVKRLEESVCGGLNKVKDLQTTAVSEKSINNIDASLKLGAIGKVGKATKSIVIDVGGGAMTAVDGVNVIGAGVVLTPEQPEIGIPVIVGGASMVVSGGNTAVNGFVDLRHEINGEWGDLGDTNVVKDIISKGAIYVSGDEVTGKSFGNKAMLTIDVIGSIKGFKDAIKIPSNFANDIKYRNGKIIDISYTPPKIKPSTGNGAFNVQGYAAIVGDVHAIGCDYYTGKTIIDDGKAVMNISDLVNPKIVAAWLEE